MSQDVKKMLDKVRSLKTFINEQDNKKKRRIWLEDGIESYIEKNPGVDSVDVVSHFNLSADVTIDSLNMLIDQGRVIRKQLNGARQGLFVAN